jgi:hypothetical protein
MAAAPPRAAQAYEEEEEDIVSVDEIKDRLNYQLKCCQQRWTVCLL